MEVEEQVNQFNSENGQAQEELLETISQIEQRLEEDRDVEDEVEQLHEEYRTLSRKRINFIPETEDFTPTKPVKALRQPKRKDYEGKRQLSALEPDLLDHKDFLDNRKTDVMEQAEQVYQRYRRQTGMEPVEQVMDIPAEMDELDELQDEYAEEISTLRNYLHNLKEVKEGETSREETDYHLPESDELIDDQIERTAEAIYQSWRELNRKEDRVKEAFQQMKDEDNEPIEMAMKYGIRPIDESVNGRENLLQEIDRYWTRLGGSVGRELPEKYSQRMT